MPLLPFAFCVTDTEAVQVHREIEAALEKEKKDLNQHESIKVLLLGKVP
jgi:hypothetical protein